MNKESTEYLKDTITASSLPMQPEQAELEINDEDLPTLSIPQDQDFTIPENFKVPEVPKAPETPKIPEKITQEAKEKKLTVYKLIDKEGANPIDNKKLQILGPKSEGVTMGFMTKDSKNLGMFKLGKYVAAIPRDTVDRGKILANRNKHTTVLDEEFAMDISRILGFPTSVVERALIETTEEQIKATARPHLEYNKKLKEYLKDKETKYTTKNLKEPIKPKSGLAKVTPKSEEIKIFPILKVDFNTDLIDLKEAVAGSDSNINHGNYRPACEGNNSNIILGEDSPQFNIFTFLTGDPDNIGKDYQNKKMLGTKLFVFDTAVETAPQLTIRSDGHLYNEYYAYDERRGTIANKLYKDVSFRNQSITDDVSLMQMLVAVDQFFEDKKDEEILIKVDSRIEELKHQEFPQQQLFINRANALKSTITDRINYLKDFLETHRAIYKKDPDLAKSLTSLEELLSPSTMYSKAGIPLRHAKIPYKEHFFCFNKEIKSETKDAPKASLYDENKNFIEENIYNNKKYLLYNEEKGLVTFIMRPLFSERIREIFPNSVGTTTKNHASSNFTCTVDDFKKYVTPERVRFITHPETISLESALQHEFKINYLKDVQRLINSLPSITINGDQVWSLSLDKLANNLTQLYRSYTALSEKKNENKQTDALESLIILENMCKLINKKITHDLMGFDLLETRNLNPTNNHDKLVELRVKIIKQQQFILFNTVQKEFESQGLSITALFAKADLLDISHSVNKLLIAGLKNPQIKEKSCFKQIIADILAFQLPVTNFIEFKEIANNFRINIDTTLSLLTLKNKAPVAPARTTSLLLTSNRPLGISEPKTSAKQDLALSVRTMTSGGNFYSSNQNSGNPTTSIPVDQQTSSALESFST